VWDPDATTENVRASSCHGARSSVRRTTRNLSGSSLLLPQGWAATAVVSAGYGGSSKPHAIADGTLRMVDNPDFTPGSIRHIIESSGTYTQHNGPSFSSSGVSGLIGSTLGGFVYLPLLLPSGPYPVVISRTTLNNILLPTAAGTTIGQILPPLAGNTSLLNVGIVLAHHPSLPHVRMTGTIDLVIVLGEIASTGLANTANLPPRIIWVDQDAKPRHVIFVGESNRRIVFATGRGNGQSTYAGFLGVTQLLLGGPLKWRLQWINEYTHMTFVPPRLFSWVECTGSIRTDWSFSCSDSGSSDKLVLKRDSAPGGLETLMPRDGWLEPYFLVR
jgi:hypothetical protein